jgi:hypothetical protein
MLLGLAGLFAIFGAVPSFLLVKVKKRTGEDMETETRQNPKSR